jgi:Mg-chelatase subunit ChlD
LQSFTFIIVFNLRVCACVHRAGDTATTAWNLQDYAANAVDLLASINTDNIPYSGGGTDLTAALAEVRQNVMSPSGGDRAGSPNVCVLITSGAGNTNGFLAEANRTKAVCKLIIVNVGNSGVSIYHVCRGIVPSVKKVD